MRDSNPQRDTLDSLDTLGEGVATLEQMESPEDQDDKFWLAQARNAFTQSTTWLGQLFAETVGEECRPLQQPLCPGIKVQQPSISQALAGVPAENPVCYSLERGGSGGGAILHG